ncbi:MAG: hypothetical protein JMDDDDMK_04780 [Acidobacteria bacterium]|nr:hypothetical protein [Acidobacteriota bacterium]
MRLAVHVERRCFRIVTKTDCAVLVRDSGERNALAQIEASREKPLMAFVPVNVAFRLLFHQLLQLRLQPLVRFQIVGRVREDNVALTVDGDAIVRIGQVFGSQPEIERMPGHQIQREAGGDGRRARRERHAVELADERDVAHREFPILRSEIEIVQAERLLKRRRVRAFRNGKQHRIDVAHVMPPDRVAGIGQPARMFVARRTQQQRRRIDRAARNRDDARRVSFLHSVSFNVNRCDLSP